MSTYTATPARRIVYGGAEMKALQRAAKHTHSGDGGITEAFGDGSNVLHVRHPSRRNRVPEAMVYVAGGTNMWGAPFVYTDYFLSEELTP